MLPTASPITLVRRAARVLPGVAGILIVAALAVMAKPGFGGGDVARGADGWTMSGIVTGPDAGTPAAGVAVSVCNVDTLACVDTTTGADGSYTATGLANGWYELWFAAPSAVALAAGYYNTDTASNWNADYSTWEEVAGADRTGMNVTLPVGYTASGTVYGAGTGPISGAVLKMWAGAYYLQTTTAGDGTYTFPGSRAYGYLNVLPPTGSLFLGGYYADAPSANYAPGEDAATALDLRSSNRTGIDITLPLGHVISGTVTGLAGAPVHDAKMVACGDAGCLEATTDGAGAFSIGPFADGSYLLGITDAPAPYLLGWYAADAPGHFVLDWAVTSMISVAGADPDPVAISLPAGPVVRGTITGPGAIAAEGAIVTACVATYCRDAITDAAGAYAVGGLPDGIAHVSVAAVGNLLGGSYALGAPGNYTASAMFASPLAIAGDDLAGIDIELPAARKISGTISGPDGPVQAARVMVCWSTALEAACLGGESGALGTYTVIGLPRGEYTVQVTHPDGTDLADGVYASGSVGNYATNWQDATPVSVVSADADGIDVTLPRTRTIEGDITGPDHAALSGAYVCAARPAETYGNCATSDGTGHYQITGLGLTPYQLHVDGPSGPPALPSGWYAVASPGNFSGAPSNATAVDTTAGNQTDASFEIPAGFTISGRITDAGGGAVEGVTIEVVGPAEQDCSGWDPTTCGWAQTQADGTYTTTVIAPMSVAIKVSSIPLGYYRADADGGYTPLLATASLISVDHDLTDINVQLPAPRSISGTITGPDGGTPVGGAHVQACSSEAPIYTPLYVYTFCTGTVLTEADGTYRMEGLAPTEYRVAVIRPDEAPIRSGYYFRSSDPSATYTADGTAATLVDLTTGDASAIDVTLPRGFTMGGTVTYTDGSPVLGGYASICGPIQVLVKAPTFSRMPTPKDSSGCPLAPFDDSGTFTVAGLQAGYYVVYLFTSGGAGIAGPTVIGAAPQTPAAAAAGAGAAYCAGSLVTTWSDSCAVLLSDADLTLADVAFPSANAALAALSISPGTLSPSFAAATTSYTAADLGGSASILVTATAVDPQATLAVRPGEGAWTPLTQGVASSPIALALGPNTIEVKATSPNRSETRTYTIAVVRAADSTPPSFTTPATVALRAGAVLPTAKASSAIPVTVNWMAVDEAAGSGLDHYVLERSVNGKAWTVVSLASPTTTSAALSMPSTGNVAYRVTACDVAGNCAQTSTGTRTARITQQTSGLVRWFGSWATTRAAAFSGGSAMYSRVGGASASYTFTGKSIALVAMRGTARGSAWVYVDGKFATTVSLHTAGGNQFRVLVWRQTFAASGTHTVKVVVAGTSGRPRVEVDAFVVLR